MRRVNKIIIMSVLTASSLLAVNIPNTDAIQNSITVPKTIEEKNEAKKNDLVDVGGKKVYEPIMIDDKSGKRILVKDYTFDGNNHILSDELNSLLDEYKNKELNFSDMQKDRKSVV